MAKLFVTILYQNTANLTAIVILVEHMVSNRGFCVMVKWLNVIEVIFGYMLYSYYPHDCNYYLWLLTGHGLYYLFLTTVKHLYSNYIRVSFKITLWFIYN